MHRGSSLLCPYFQPLAIHIIYHQTSNIKRTLVGNKIVDHSDVVEALPVVIILDLKSGFNGLGKNNCKTWETFKGFGAP